MHDSAEFAGLAIPPFELKTAGETAFICRHKSSFGISGSGKVQDTACLCNSPCGGSLVSVTESSMLRCAMLPRV